ncbi:hypothetical protein WJX84_009313 [Apatococcus fuscideae]|uniref:Uncharacterized protein n=1 Tax=Apatococcus fuscideae TaxID=2026836 RepID=A0AAW1SPY7_9CHLO
MDGKVLPTLPRTSAAPRTGGSLFLQALVDKDFRLRKTWQINLDELQLVLDGQRRPVILGKGASGTVYLGILDGV